MSSTKSITYFSQVMEQMQVEIQKLFIDTDIQSLCLNWIRTYSTWNWAQILSIFKKNDKEQLKKQIVIAKGKIQSGKSKFMIIINPLVIRDSMSA